MDDFEDSANGNARRSRSTGFCLCVALGLALVGAISPYWLWRTSFTYYVKGDSTIVGTGGFVTSSSSAEWGCPMSGQCFIMHGWNHYSEFNDTICSKQFFDKIGEYGFCKGGVGGEFQTPSGIVAIQVLTILTCIFVFFASVSSVCAPTVRSRKLAFIGLISCTLGCITSLSSFAVACNVSWYTALRSGASIPFITGNKNCDGDHCLYLFDNMTMVFGPAFWSMVMCFLITFVSSLLIFSVTKKMPEDYEHSQGSFGQGLAYNETYYVDDGSYRYQNQEPYYASK